MKWSRRVQLAAVMAAWMQLPVSGGSITLDADTPATGSNLDTLPLVTSLGTITFVGEIRDKDSDPEFDAAGASGDVFDVGGTSGGPTAEMSFDFDVDSIEFIYGGNGGVFDIEARDIGGGVVDSFFQADTGGGQPAGPITLSGSGIRSIFWEDPGFSFSAIDNVVITADIIPEPSTMALAILGLLGIGFVRRKPM